MSKYTEYKKQWYLKKKKRNRRNCEVCGKEIGFTAKKCPSCSAKERSLWCPPPDRTGKQCHLVGEKNKMWKGDDVGYIALHQWVYREKGKADICVLCGSKRKVEWANKSHTYKRTPDDWIKLCKQCHVLFDRGKLNI